jgi:hypothetical protein
MRLLLLAAVLFAAPACTSATAPSYSACHGGGGMSQGSDTRCR